jgi:amino acid adenylation domain-containing protein
VVGSPIAGRTRPELEELIGFFVNTLALRGDLSGEPTVRELLRRTREMTLGAYEHQEVPFERLVEELQPVRSLSHSPLFQVMFTLAAHDAGTLRFGEVEELRANAGTTAWDLDLTLAERDGGLVGTLEYRAELFEPATVRRMADAFATLLEAMAAHPDERISTLLLLPPKERRKVMEEWNATAYEFPRDLCIHHVIEQRARMAPHAAAVMFDGGALSYAELDARANRLARHLRKLGVGPEVRVGISVARGPDMAVAILGVLKAGGAYVPLDPAYPAERVAYMLADSGARVLLTQEALVSRLPATGAHVVRLDADADAISAESAKPLESGATADNLAYVIYTSGSTGRPKGVALAHRAMVNYALDFAARVGLGSDDRVLQFASLSFDVVVEELFPAWFSGGAVVFSSADLFSPPELMRAIDAHGVTWVELPTAYWHEWTHELVRPGASLPLSLRFVAVGGERVLPESLAEWARLRLPLVHVFGLTETACTSATLSLSPGDDGSRWANLPAGTPTAVRGGRRAAAVADRRGG